MVELGVQARHSAQTKMNERSSRSHCMLCVKVRGQSKLTGTHASFLLCYLSFSFTGKHAGFPPPQRLLFLLDRVLFGSKQAVYPYVWCELKYWCLTSCHVAAHAAMCWGRLPLEFGPTGRRLHWFPTNSESQGMVCVMAGAWRLRMRMQCIHFQSLVTSLQLHNTICQVKQG